MKKEGNNWSIVKRARSFANAFRGIMIILRTQPNIWIQLLSAIVVILLGFAYDISSFEWMALTFAIGFVVVAEGFNSALEVDIDLTSPEYHPYARDTKDIAAGAVLLASITATVIGLIIFVPKIFY